MDKPIYTIKSTPYKGTTYHCVTLTEESNLLVYLYSIDASIREEFALIKSEKELNSYTDSIKKYYNDLDVPRDIKIKKNYEDSNSYTLITNTTIRKVLTDILSEFKIRPSSFGNLAYYYVDGSVYVVINKNPNDEEEV